MIGLSAFAAQLTLARALRDQTIAGRDVLVSPRESLDTKTRPFITVSMPDNEATGSARPEGRDIANAQGTFTLRVSIFVPAHVKVVDGTTILDMSGGSSEELILCAAWQQCVYAMQVAAEGSWNALFQEFCQKITEIKAIATQYQTQAGGRIASRQVDMHVSGLSEPIRGRPATGAWSRLLSKLTSEGDPESIAISNYMRHMIERNDLGPWQVVAAGLAISEERLGEVGDGSADWLVRDIRDK